MDSGGVRGGRCVRCAGQGDVRREVNADTSLHSYSLAVVRCADRRMECTMRWQDRKQSQKA